VDGAQSGPQDASRAAVNPAASAGDSGATRPHRTAEKYLMDIGYVKPLEEKANQNKGAAKK
jgi:hypothetical protein